jgi:hypothetical protein
MSVGWVQQRETQQFPALGATSFYPTYAAATQLNP